MTGEGEILDLFRAAIATAALVGGPFVITALAVDMVVAVLQAATQLQENALSFVPKFIAVGIVLLMAGPWVLSQLTSFTTRSFTTIAHVGQTAATARNRP